MNRSKQTYPRYSHDFIIIVNCQLYRFDLNMPVRFCCVRGGRALRSLRFFLTAFSGFLGVFGVGVLDGYCLSPLWSIKIAPPVSPSSPAHLRSMREPW